MRLAFYYHITIAHKSDGFYLPGFLGVFIDALAGNCNELYLLAHKSTGSDQNLKKNRQSSLLLKAIRFLCKKVLL